MTENNGEDRPELLLSELTTVEVDRLRDKIELVLLPFGATEQHGPHLALGTDTFCREASRRLYPRLLVASLGPLKPPHGLPRHHQPLRRHRHAYL